MGNYGKIVREKTSQEGSGNMINKVSAIFADIDGTLVNKGENIMPVTKQALETLHSQGVLLGLSTGRKINNGMFQRAKDWGLSFQFDMMIGMNGGQLWDRFHPEIENYYLLKTETMKEIIERMSPLDLNVMIYEDEHMVTLRFDDMIAASMKRNHMKVVVADGNADRLCVNDNYNVLFRFDPERTEEVAAFAETLACEKYHAILTSPGIIEFMDPRISKGFALEQLHEMGEYALEEIMAFGDTTNDNAMIETAAWGVCLKNGSDDTKAIADDITRYDCKHDGFADYIEEHLF